MTRPSSVPPGQAELAPTGPRVKFTSHQGDETIGRLVRVTDFAVEIDTGTPPTVVGWTGANFSLEPIAATS